MGRDQFNLLQVDVSSLVPPALPPQSDCQDSSFETFLLNNCGKNPGWQFCSMLFWVSELFWLHTSWRSFQYWPTSLSSQSPPEDSRLFILSPPGLGQDGHISTFFYRMLLWSLIDNPMGSSGQPAAPSSASVEGLLITVTLYRFGTLINDQLKLAKHHSITQWQKLLPIDPLKSDADFLFKNHKHSPSSSS